MNVSLTASSKDHNNLRDPLIKPQKQSCWGRINQKVTEKGDKIIKCLGVIYGTVLAPSMILAGFKCASTGATDFACAAAHTHNGVLVLGSLGVAAGYRYIKKKMTQAYPHHQYYQGNFLKVSFMYMYNHLKSHDSSITTYRLDEAFESLRKLSLLNHWMKLKKYPDLETAKKAQHKRMTAGLCFGHSAAMMNLMPKYGHLNSEALIEKLKFEDIHLFQFFSNQRREIMDYLSTHDKKTSREFINFLTVNFDSYFLIILQQLQKLSFDLDGVYFYSFEYINITSNFEDQRRYFTNAFTSFENDVKNKRGFCLGKTEISPRAHSNRVFCGIITLVESQKSHDQRMEKEREKSENKEAKEIETEEEASNRLRKHAHALFFQFDNYYYRFQDSGSTLAGFFNFPTEEEFFKGLTQHLQTWELFKDGELNISLLSMPKQTIETIPGDMPLDITTRQALRV